MSYAIMNLYITPREWEMMNRQEKAFIIASIDIHTEQTKQEQAKAERLARTKRRR